jgi:uncharacterized membrane protein
MPRQPRIREKARIFLVEVTRMNKIRNGVVVHLGKGSMTLLTILGLVLLSLVSPTIVVRILENLHEIAKAFGLP